MTTGQDTELRTWMEAWQAEGETPVDLRERILRRVRRQSFYQKAWAVGEAAIVLMMTAFLVWVGVNTTQTADIVVVVAFLILQAWALVYGYRSRRGLWRPRDESAAAFLDLSLRRCEQRLKLTRAGYVILAVEVAVFVPWLWLRTQPDAARAASLLGTRAGAYGFLALFVAAALAALIYAGHRTRRDLAALQDLERSLTPINGER